MKRRSSIVDENVIKKNNDTENGQVAEKISGRLYVMDLCSSLQNFEHLYLENESINQVLIYYTSKVYVVNLFSFFFFFVYVPFGAT